LAQFSSKPCDGELRRVHLIAKQALRRRGHDLWDERAWVWACGGPWPGLSGCHGRFDAFKLRVPREALPAGVEELAAELGMLFYLDRRFGPLPGAAMDGVGSVW
jgi:hypothetical protein